MLAILTTHPIQYQVPLWKALAKEGSVPFEVWFMSDHAFRLSFDNGFKQTFAWNLDMLEGYPSRFLKTNENHNVARFSRLRLAEPLGDLLRQKNVKALWIQGWQVAAYWQAVWQANAAGIPVWLRGESNDLAVTSLLKKPLKRIALKKLFSRVAEFLYIGEANRRLYQQYGIAPQRLHPAYYCVDNERFSRQAEILRPMRKQLRREWKIPDDSFCVLFAGKFIPKKRPLDIVAASTLLKTSNRTPPLHLLFAGSGELGPKLRGACSVVFDEEANGEPQNSSADKGKPYASFVGFLNQREISKAYVAADCLILPSDQRETWGLVVNEAMASGLPCIVSDACGCTEDLIAAINSRLRFRLGDAAALSDAMLSIMNEPTPAAILRDRVNRFSVSASASSVSHLYRSTLL
jgi:glycosyltransferase involved in cell wall biosynthesis